ncbi:inositol 1,4,5-trisphosphate receptor-interacting protein-like 1 [Phaenicophaeus curvirostris]|uniref:inositol 1,4,5-trisphosphate receptor-interacting protein-like 1 n=1 Tax=Phaenicophaeus curvirostris TaxID=33595 RepID=UPI0037F0ECBB
MAQRAQFLQKETALLWQEIEESSLEQWDFAWGPGLSTALQQWHLWVIAGGLVLLLYLCWCLRKRSHEADSSSTEEMSFRIMKQVEEEEESEGEVPNDELNLSSRIEIVKALVRELLWVFHECFCNSFFPMLQPAIGVGSTFEGWSPCEDDAVHQLLLPLKAPPGHTFQLEMGTTWDMPAEDPCIRVELTKNQDPRLLHSLCTGSYLDVQKTARWFQKFVMSAWRDVSHSHHYILKILPSSRSCKLQLTNASRRTLFIELVFGVQQEESDIFLSSQATEDTSIPSTTWPVTYAVAEVKFLRHMARQAQTKCVYLRCLWTCTYILMDTSSYTSYTLTYTFKTAVMHLLTTIPLSEWHRTNFLLRLRDIMQYVLCCLEEKCLNHFFLGNENVPEEISLPPSFRKAKPLNLFQRFTQDPAAYADTLRDFKEMQNQLIRLFV